MSMLAGRHETRREPSGTQPEQRIRRAAIENRRPSAVCEREGHVRHRHQRQIRMAEYRICGWIGRSVDRRRRRDQRDSNITSEQASDEIVDVPLEPAVPVQRVHRPRQNRDAQ